MDGTGRRRHVDHTGLADLEAYLQRQRTILAPPADEPAPTPPPESYGRPRRRSRSVLMRGVTPQQVWDVVRPVEGSYLDPRVERAWVEPGTGPGVGEVHVVVRRSGQVERTRIVDERPPWFLETEALLEGMRFDTSYELRERRRGTRFTLTSTVHPPAGRVVVDLSGSFRDLSDKLFGWVREELQRRSG